MSDYESSVVIEGETTKSVSEIYQIFKFRFGEAIYTEEKPDGSIEYFDYDRDTCVEVFSGGIVGFYRLNYSTGNVEFVISDELTCDAPSIIAINSELINTISARMYDIFGCTRCLLVIKNWYNGCDQPQIKNFEDKFYVA